MNRRQKETWASRLGRLLAYLVNENNNGENKLPPLTSAEKAQLEELQNRQRALLRNDCTDGWPETVPETECQTEQAYLEGNVDFFVAHLTIGSTADKEMDCQRFMRHMNDCFRCFNAYVAVVTARHETLNGRD